MENEFVLSVMSLSASGSVLSSSGGGASARPKGWWKSKFVKVKAWQYGQKGEPYFPQDYEIVKSDILQVTNCRLQSTDCENPNLLDCELIVSYPFPFSCVVDGCDVKSQQILLYRVAYGRGKGQEVLPFVHSLWTYR